jgi:hypothetical protein
MMINHQSASTVPFARQSKSPGMCAFSLSPGDLPKNLAALIRNFFPGVCTQYTALLRQKKVFPVSKVWKNFQVHFRTGFSKPCGPPETPAHQGLAIFSQRNLSPCKNVFPAAGIFLRMHQSYGIDPVFTSA